LPTDLGVLSLFTGAGGLDLGLEGAGFSTRLCVENDPIASATLRTNRPKWTLAETNDAIEFAKDPHAALKAAGLAKSDIAVLAGGPPCQPFSKAGYWIENQPKRMDDPRAGTINAYLDIVRDVKPPVLLFENVPAFAFKGKDEGITAFRAGLEAVNRSAGTSYKPSIFLVNAADYGVPQTRERIFVVAARDGTEFRMPAPTYGTGARHGRYVTAWDAIGDLDELTPDDSLTLQGKWADLLPSIPEGKNYLWHTPEGGGLSLFGWRTRFWSFLLKLSKRLPAWTIQASPGPATGPFHWRNRLLSVDELARLQSFPKAYSIDGARGSCQRQIGNAVPPVLAEVIGLEIRRQLFGSRLPNREISLAIPHRNDRPRAFPTREVPYKYRALVARHKPHPGVGKGPGSAAATVTVHSAASI